MRLYQLIYLGDGQSNPTVIVSTVQSWQISTKFLKPLGQFLSSIGTRFIKLCEKLVEEFGTGSHINLLALLKGILNKVTGPLTRLINSNDPDNWDGIRKALINNFVDQRDRFL